MVEHLLVNEQVLFVDDDESIRESFALCLRTKGLVVATAKSAQEAMWIIENATISLVILDVELGNENGLDLLAQLKQTHPKLPVIMFTSHGEDVEMLTDALASGAEGYLSKNESVGILIKEVERVLQRSDTRSAEADLNKG